MISGTTVSKLSQLRFSEHSKKLEKKHFELLMFNHKRFKPTSPNVRWRDEIENQVHSLMTEGELIEQDRHDIQPLMNQVPQEPKAFMEWFLELRNTGPGQGDPLFPWLAKSATLDQMKYFLRQEVAGEAGFEDLTALTQLKMPSRIKLELARNYWDEMGRGNERGMHGPLLSKLATELQINGKDGEPLLAETIALANLMIGMAANRRFAYHSLGALGVIELTAPDRAKYVYQGLKRLGVSSEGQRYYLLHSTLDVKHSLAWNDEVIEPLILENAELGKWIAEGALMRLNAGARCFARYRQVLWEE
ncbi:MAG: iron-containing redox enzyme family protein [Bdellovibrionia bacterium]